MDWTPDVIDRVIELRTSRKSWPAIAQELDTTRSSIMCALQRSGRTLPDVGTIMPTTRKSRVRCEAVTPAETVESRDAPAIAPAKIRPYILDTCDWTWWFRQRGVRGCVVDHYGKPCGRTLFAETDRCLGHTVDAFKAEFEDWKLRLALITESSTPRRLAAAIRQRIETHRWTLAEWSEAVGLPQSTAYKALASPDDHPKSFAKIASHFGFDFDAALGVYRRRRKTS
ncbi:hypothetical protein [Lichenifustis flavocetrariae]|uniref:Uncharacterized protein n=1 Tax=Lichenifustis flavocetrariae TaxID=2949735 RepID=A0AA41Z3B3_9HYPH|nr:hypothetical protein [Lichenifustis flavocetrariae]MCW6512118.1 hypothetical protein [Lichenifustis flavocetrariae]